MDKCPKFAVLRNGEDEVPFNIFVIIISVTFVRQKGKRNNGDVRRYPNVTLAQELSQTEEIFRCDRWWKVGVFVGFVWGEGGRKVG